MRSGGDGPQRVEMHDREQDRPARLAVPRRPQDLARSVPCASISEVIVSGPTQVIRAGQSRTALVSWTSAIASSAPRTIWPAGPASGGAGEP